MTNNNRTVFPRHRANLKFAWQILHSLLFTVCQFKVNYKIHTNTIKENLIPRELAASQIDYVYASEADICFI